ncbi:uncharacterized protein LOC142302826 [Anomaloglossus baeobatrachus]|uniref:uncharacterized protein LOC142302826 n=1 Tax=Anomaloglossus baeobatrachus TaxID=238106 RepID=UPI003F4FD853
MFSENIMKESSRDLEVLDRMKTSDPSGHCRDRVNFVDRHQSTLIRRTTAIRSILEELHGLLTAEQRTDVMENTTSEEQMEELCDILSYLKDNEKCNANRVLRKYNMEILRDLEMKDWIRRYPLSGGSWDKVNCIDRHRSDLIRNINVIDPVLHDLRDQDLLTPKQTNDVNVKSTSEEKVEELCEIVSQWEDTEKYTAYKVLRKYNKKVIGDLEMEDWMRRNDPSGSFTDNGNFIDYHQYDLFRRIKAVDPVLRGLRERDLLTEEQINDVMEKTSSEEKMEELCDVISHWEDTGKYTAYTVLREHNEEIIRDLEMKHWILRSDPSGYLRDMITFIDDHKADLIGNVNDVDSVLRDLRDQDLLTEDQYNDVMEKTKSREKMRELCGIIKHWEDIEKYTAYTVLRKYNEEIMASLMSDFRISGGVCDITNLIDYYRDDLITSVTNVDLILLDLLDQDLLTEEQYNNLMEKTSSEEKMEELCDLISHWDDTGKGMAYRVLNEHNEETIRDLEMDDMRRRYFPSGVIAETEDLQMSHMKTTVDGISCSLCGKEQESVDLVEGIRTTDGMYRLELKSPGLYRCQKTALKFLVNGPVIIEYKVDSWRDHLKDIPENTYEILGPLFNIRISGDPSAVSAVHLPHYLCLKSFSEDTAMINCAQFKDGKMALLTPTEINPFSILLENPTFSHLGVILTSRRSKIQIHGMVLIYLIILYKVDAAEQYLFHLYVMPYCRNSQEILDEYQLDDGFLKIDKPPHIEDPVQKNIKYRVAGYPEEVTVYPQTLMFQSDFSHYTEILVTESCDTFLYLSEENTSVEVWDTRLTQGEIRKAIGPRPKIIIRAGGTNEHFVDRRRKELIDDISSVVEVLDDLKQHKLISNHAYDDILSRSSPRDQMREIYRYVGSWDTDDKDFFYQALEKHNPSTIKKLKRM